MRARPADRGLQHRVQTGDRRVSGDLVNTNAETETRNDGGLVDCGAA